MNPNPRAKRILCYGDSNTWGRSGNSVDRYPSNIRWTGLLQEKLGETHEIIEEGLRSRTTDFEDDDPDFPGRNGLAYLRPCIESHNPLDLVILWLGTNDLKSRFKRSPREIGDSIRKLISVIQENAYDRQSMPSKILLISPPLVLEVSLGSGNQFDGAGPKSRDVGNVLKRIASDANCEFLDLAPIVQPGDFDGVHLEPESHKTVADRMFEFIKEIL